jgi:hypothetical protein
MKDFQVPKLIFVQIFSHRSVSWNRDLSSDKLSFTMRREFDKHKEEEELIKQLKSVRSCDNFCDLLFSATSVYCFQILQTKLKMSLPDDIAPALTDGVVLCHLANHIKPRSVGSIHVPSPAVVSRKFYALFEHDSNRIQSSF